MYLMATYNKNLKRSPSTMIRASTNSQVRYQVNFVVINKHKLAAGTNWYHGVNSNFR